MLRIPYPHSNIPYYVWIDTILPNNSYSLHNCDNPYVLVFLISIYNSYIGRRETIYFDIEGIGVDWSR